MRKTTLLFSFLAITNCSTNPEQDPEIEIPVEYQSNFEDLWEPEKRQLPEYPLQEIDRGIEVCVLIGFAVNSEGIPSELKVLATSPPVNVRKFKKAAMEALSQWRYVPTSENISSKPGKTWTVMTFTFSDGFQDAVANRCK